MTESMRERGMPGSSPDVAESSLDYRVREVEARLARRLDALESQRSTLKRMTLLLGAGLAAAVIALVVVLTTGSAQESLTTARLFAEEVVLRGPDGVTRGSMGLDEDGRVQLSLSDRDGRTRMRLAVLGDGSPGLTISDDQAHPRVVLGYLPDGTTSLVFADAQGISRAVVGLGPDGSTHALFADRGGVIRTLMGVGADGQPSMSLVEGDETAPAPDPTTSY